jgi:hypothetical protein
VNGQKAEISTRESDSIDKWNSPKGRIKGTNVMVKIINTHLDNWKTKVKKFHNTFIRDKKRISAQILKDAVLGISEKDEDFFYYFEAEEKDIGSKLELISSN